MCPVVWGALGGGGLGGGAGGVVGVGGEGVGGGVVCGGAGGGDVVGVLRAKKSIVFEYTVVRGCWSVLHVVLSVKLIGHPAVVVFGSGHGGIDEGNAGQRRPRNRNTLDVAKRLAEFWRARRIKVVLTRTGDYLFLYTGEPLSPTGKLDHRDVLCLDPFQCGWRRALRLETYYIPRAVSVGQFNSSRVIQALSSIDRGHRQRLFRLRRKPVPAV